MNVEFSLLQTPFVSSWVGKAVRGDLHSSDLESRSRAWAYWAVTNIETFTGANGREYQGIKLPGEFYKAPNFGTPHLEIPSWLLNKVDSEFPLRLAALGNGLNFGWWLPAEATATKRAMLLSGPVSAPLYKLEATRDALVTTVEDQTAYLKSNWSKVEDYLAKEQVKLSRLLATGFSSEDIIAFHPDMKVTLGLKTTQMSARMDEKLAGTAGTRLARRVGLWTVSLGDVSWGCLTPRLTKSSQCGDRLYLPTGESTTSLLVRGLILKALLDNAGLGGAHEVPHTWVSSTKGSLRAMPARNGEALPKASDTAVVAFVNAYPRANDAWQAIQKWCASRPESACLVIPTKETFLKSHRRVREAAWRSQRPDPVCTEVVMPLVWSTDNSTGERSILRLTFVRS